MLDINTDIAASYFTVFDKLVFYLQSNINWNGKGQSHEPTGSGEDLGVDADNFSLHIEERAARIAGIDSDVCLNERHVLVSRKVAGERRHNAGSHGIVKTKRTANGCYPFANLELVGVSHLQRR